MTQTVSITMYDLSLDKAREALDALEKIGVSTEYPARNESLKDHPQHIEGEGKKPSIEMPPAEDEEGFLETGDPAGDDAPPETTETPEKTPAPADAKRDKRGLLHDLRIHTPAETFLANGNWKIKRGTDKALVAQVEAELFAEAADFKQGAGRTGEIKTTEGTEMELPPEPGTDGSPEMELPPELGTEETAKTETTAPAAGPQFPALMQYYIEQMGLKKIDATKANKIAVDLGVEVCREGITALAFLAAHEDLVPIALQRMQEACA